MTSLKERMQQATMKPPPTPEERKEEQALVPTAQPARGSKLGTVVLERAKETSKNKHWQNIKSIEKRDKVLALRKRGLTYGEIGKKLGLSASRVCVIVHKALEEIRERTEESTDAVREMELQRVDALLSSTWSLATKNSSKVALTEAESVNPDKVPVEVKFKAMDRVMKLLDHRAKLLGLYAPKKMEIGPMSPSEYSDEQLLQVIKDSQFANEQRKAQVRDAEYVEPDAEEANDGE